MRRWVALLVAVGGCVAEAPMLEVVVDAPPPGAGAHPYDGLEQLRLWVAREGDDAPLALATVAVGEPLTLGAVPFGDDLVVHLSGRASGVEIAYGRSCPISVQSDEEPVTPHLYFSRIVRWGAAPTPARGDRTGGASYVLAGDGSAVFAGGDAATGEVERFDPTETGSFQTLPVSTADRRGAVMARFSDDSAVIVGGVNAGGDAVPVVEHLDPLGVEGRQLSQQSGPTLAGHAAASLVDGTVVVAGGRTQEMPGGAFSTTGVGRLFRIGAGGVLEPALLLSSGLAKPRSEHTMTRLGDEVGADVLIVGGMDGLGAPVAEVELYRPLREAFEQINGAVLLTPRWGHRAARMPGGSILVIGGLEPDPGGGPPLPVRMMELYDPVQGRFVAAGELPVGAGLTELSVTTLPDGRVMLAGGLDESGQPVATVLIARLDSINGQVDLSITDSLSIPRAGHQAAGLCDGTILIVGGTGDVGAHAERYNPPSAGRL